METIEQINEAVEGLFERLTQNGKTFRFIEYYGQKVYELIIPSKERKGVYERWHKADRGDKGIMHNACLEPHEVKMVYRQQLIRKYNIKP